MSNFPSLSDVERLAADIQVFGAEEHTRLSEKLARVMIHQLAPTQILAALRSEAGNEIAAALAGCDHAAAVRTVFARPTPNYTDLKVVLRAASFLPEDQSARIYSSLLCAGAAQASVAQLYGFFMSPEVEALRQKLAGSIIAAAP